MCYFVVVLINATYYSLFMYLKLVFILAVGTYHHQNALPVRPVSSVSDDALPCVQQLGRHTGVPQFKGLSLFDALCGCVVQL